MYNNIKISFLAHHYHPVITMYLQSTTGIIDKEEFMFLAVEPTSNAFKFQYNIKTCALDRN